MPVITRCEVGIYAFQQFDSWLIVRILRHKFTVNGKVEDFGFGLFDYCLQIDFILFYLAYQSKPPFYFLHNSLLLR